MTFLAALKWMGDGFWSFASSRAGQIVIAFVVAWLWSGYRADEKWRAYNAAATARAEAAYRAEAARQEEAARNIAEAATARAEEDDAVMRALRDRIAEFDATEKKSAPARLILPSPLPVSVCTIDRTFAGVVRRFDAAGSGTKSAPRRPR